MYKDILKKLKTKKKELLLKDGFEIVGVFGSYAKERENHQSDIDILYDIKPKFIEKHSGFSAFSRLNEIRAELETLLGRDVDIATVDNSSKVFKEHALKDVVSV